MTSFNVRIIRMTLFLKGQLFNCFSSNRIFCFILLSHPRPSFLALNRRNNGEGRVITKRSGLQRKERLMPDHNSELMRLVVERVPSNDAFVTS